MVPGHGVCCGAVGDVDHEGLTGGEGGRGLQEQTCLQDRFVELGVPWDHPPEYRPLHGEAWELPILDVVVLQCLISFLWGKLLICELIVAVVKDVRPEQQTRIDIRILEQVQGNAAKDVGTEITFLLEHTQPV